MSIHTRRALAVAGAVAAPAAVWLVATAAGVPLRVTAGGQPPEPVELPAVLVFALVGSLAGSLALAVLERVTRHGAAVWTVLAAVVLLASLVPPLTVQASTATHVTLVTMHLAVAAVLVPGLRRPAVSRTPAPVASLP